MNVIKNIDRSSTFVYYYPIIITQKVIVVLRNRLCGVTLKIVIVL